MNYQYDLKISEKEYQNNLEKIIDYRQNQKSIEVLTQQLTNIEIKISKISTDNDFMKQNNFYQEYSDMKVEQKSNEVNLNMAEENLKQFKEQMKLEENELVLFCKRRCTRKNMKNQDEIDKDNYLDYAQLFININKIEFDSDLNTLIKFISEVISNLISPLTLVILMRRKKKKI